MSDSIRISNTFILYSCQLKITKGGKNVKSLILLCDIQMNLSFILIFFLKKITRLVKVLSHVQLKFIDTRTKWSFPFGQENFIVISIYSTPSFCNYRGKSGSKKGQYPKRC